MQISTRGCNNLVVATFGGQTVIKTFGDSQRVIYVISKKLKSSQAIPLLVRCENEVRFVSCYIIVNLWEEVSLLNFSGFTYSIEHFILNLKFLYSMRRAKIIKILYC